MSPCKEAFACALGTVALTLGGAGTAFAQTNDDGTTTLRGAEQTLPFTGAEPAWVAGAGLLLVGVGVAVRRLSTAHG
jgi:hypothetical protein